MLIEKNSIFRQNKRVLSLKWFRVVLFLGNLVAPPILGWRFLWPPPNGVENLVAQSIVVENWLPPPSIGLVNWVASPHIRVQNLVSPPSGGDWFGLPWHVLGWRIFSSPLCHGYVTPLSFKFFIISFTP